MEYFEDLNFDVTLKSGQKTIIRGDLQFYRPHGFNFKLKHGIRRLYPPFDLPR